MHAIARAVAPLLLALAVLVSAQSLAEEPPQSTPNAPVANAPALPIGADAGSLDRVISALSGENRSSLGQMLATDWKDRPEWGDMLVALLQGERMQPPVGWYRPSEMEFHFDWFLAEFDANADGMVGKSELPQDMPDLDRVFSRLDRDNDASLQRSDFDYASGRQATMPQMASQFLFSLLDGDSNGRITASELDDFFSRADEEKMGFLAADDLSADLSREFAVRNGLAEDMPGAEQMLAMFMRGELGLWDPGPKLGDQAPDFTLPMHDGGQTVTLSQRRGKPVILIFGSFT